MSLPKKPSLPGIKMNLPSVGLNAARCFAIIDIGTQAGMYKGVPKTPQREIMIFFEFGNSTTVIKEGQLPLPYVIGQSYSYSLGDKAKLPNVLKSWFLVKEITDYSTLKNVVGHYAMINITHSDDGKYANIGSGGRSINPFIKEVTKPAKHYENIWYELPDVNAGEKFNWEEFEKLPFKAKKAIRLCEEFPGIVAKFPEPTKDAPTPNNTPNSSKEEEEDELPF